MRRICPPPSPCEPSIVSIGAPEGEELVEEDEGFGTGAVLVLQTVAGKKELAGDDGLGRGDSDVDEADGLGGCGSTGSGDAGGGDAIVDAGAVADAAGHGFGGVFADGAVGLECFGWYAEEVGFGLVAIGDDATVEVVAAAGDVGEEAGEESAGAGFGGGDCDMELVEALRGFIKKFFIYHCGTSDGIGYY